MGVISQCVHGTSVEVCRCPKIHDPVKIVGCPDRCPKKGQPVTPEATVTKVEYLFPGLIVTETSVRDIDAESVQLAQAIAPSGAYAFRFLKTPPPIPGYTPEVTERGHFYYLGGVVFDLEEAKAKFGEDSNVVWNMIHNGYDRAVHSPSGGVYLLNPEDVVL